MGVEVESGVECYWNHVEVAPTRSKEVSYKYIEVSFEDGTPDSLELCLAWSRPPSIKSTSVSINASATTLPALLQCGDELIEVCELDIREMQPAQILPLLQQRPL